MQPVAAWRRLQTVTHSLLLGTLLLAPAAAADADRRAARDACDLLAELVFVAPTPLQQPMIDQAWALYAQWLTAPGVPDPALSAALLRTTAALYTRVRRHHPAVLIAWNATGVQRGDGTRPLTFACGVPYVVLVEASNAMACAGQFSVTAPGVTTASKAPVWIGAGEVRALWLCVRVDSATAPALALSIARIDQPQQRQLNLPLHLVAPARITGTLRDDATGAPVPGRVYVRDSAGQLRYGLPHGTNDTFLNKPVLQFTFAGKAVSQTMPFFYTDGRFEITVPPGRTTVTMERGYEHLPVSTNVVLAPGAVAAVTLAPRRMIDMRARGWVSGDTHVHWAKNSWHENEAMPLLAMVQRAEDLRVVNNLTLLHSTGTHYFIAPTQFPMGPVPGYCDAEYHLEMGEEYRNEEFYGHINILNITNIIAPISTGSINVPPHWDYPINATAFHAAHAQGGIVCEAHGLGRNNDVPVNVIQGLSDALDQLEPDDYYRFLDCGIQIPLANGSDHPARITGCVRTYVKSTEAGAASADQGGSGFHPAIAAAGHGSPSHIQEKSRLYQGWIDGIRSNRTFTTSGPLLLLDVNGHDIGDVLHVTAATPLRITARALARHPLGTVEIISNGRVLAATNTTARTAELTLTMPAGESRWLVARCSPTNIYNVLYAPNAAHTSAIYINVDGRPRILPAAVQEWINRMTIHAHDLEKNGRFENDTQRQEAVAHVRAGIAAYQRLLPVSTSTAIRLTPVPVTTPLMRQAGMRDGQDLNRVRFHVQAPWMSGPVELRIPEVLKSTWGYHFLDHYMAQIPPLHEWRAYPQWQKDEASGRIWYDFTTPEGLRLIASAAPVGDEVQLAYTVVNQSTQSIAYVEPNCCLALNDCPELNDKNNISSLYAGLNGTLAALDTTTPTPAQMGRTPWLVMTRTTPKPALDSPMLWCVDQPVSDNLMAAVTRDRAHLVGYTWSVEPAYLMSNCGNPCLHTGMGSSPEIPPGKSFTWRGRIYCMTNDPAALLARCRRDQELFRRQAHTGEKSVAPLAQSKDRVRVAVAQMQIKPETLKPGQDTVDALAPWIQRAAAEKADLVVLPEYLLGPFHLPDALTDKLCGVAKSNNINVIVGGWEYLPGKPIQHPPASGTYANTVLVISRAGTIAGTHRKMHAALGAGSPYCWPPEPGERGENTMVLGEENGVVDLDFGRIGLLTCYDGYFFESFMMPSLRGAEVLVWVNSRGGMIEPHIVQAASFMTCTHVVGVNQAVGCGSVICAYPGWKLDAVAPKLGDETMLVANLDLAALRTQRVNNRMLHQRRPEIYTPLVAQWQPWEAYPNIKPFSYPAKEQQ